MAEQDNKPTTVVVSSTTGIPEGMQLKTPAGMPNIVVSVVTPLRRMLVRALRVYVQSLLGFLPLALGAGQAIANAIAPGQIVLPQEFGAQLLLAASAAIAPAVTALLSNLAELLVKWDAV